MKQPARVPTQLSEPMHKRLNAYALAASAAGVGVLALAQPAEGRIVYTPAYRHIENHSSYSLDLNHDGIVDFRLEIIQFYSSDDFRVYTPPYGSGTGKIVGKRNQGNGRALALKKGAIIGRASVKIGALLYNNYFSGAVGPCLGPWAGDGNGVRNRYLGLKFSISGKVHYGWARLSVYCIEPNADNYGLSGVLTGYAYETIPNKPIIAGKTHGKGEATLGRLAQGASGIAARR